MRPTARFSTVNSRSGKSARSNAREDTGAVNSPAAVAKIILCRGEHIRLERDIPSILSSMSRGNNLSKSVFLFPAMRERWPACELKFEREEAIPGSNVYWLCSGPGNDSYFRSTTLVLRTLAVSENCNRRGAAVLAFAPCSLSWRECSGFISTRPLIPTRLEINCLQDHSGRALGKRCWKSRTRPIWLNRDSHH